MSTHYIPFINIVPVYVSARYMFQSPNYNHRLHMVEHSYCGNLLKSMFCRRACFLTIMKNDQTYYLGEKKLKTKTRCTLNSHLA